MTQNLILQHLTEALSRFSGVQKIILFGSRATGVARFNSDIDLAIVGVQDELEWTRIRQVVDEARTLLKIDLVRFETAAHVIRESILREGQVLYER